MFGAADEFRLVKLVHVVSQSFVEGTADGPNGENIADFCEATARADRHNLDARIRATPQAAPLQWKGSP